MSQVHGTTPPTSDRDNPGLDTASRPLSVVLTGNPNSGKSTLFNALTGLRAKVGNYAGVTVERKEGRLLNMPGINPITVLDLPGTYSLSPRSMDERVARDVLFCRLREVPAPDIVVLVVDASNLQRNLYYATQVIELGYPTVMALNMVDVARDIGLEIDAQGLERELGVPVVRVVANADEGLNLLRSALLEALSRRRVSSRRDFVSGLPASFLAAWTSVQESLDDELSSEPGLRRVEALLLLTDERFLEESSTAPGSRVLEAVQSARRKLDSAGVDWRSCAIEARYTRLTEIQALVTVQPDRYRETASDKIDRVLTHKFWGMLIFVGIMALMFQTLFIFAQLPMNAIEWVVKWVAAGVGTWMPPGDLQSLLVDGVIGGVGNVIVFLPQILMLFFFIGLLEDTGYMARAAFLMDRVMSKVGLHGKSFIPMLSSFACAIPGIMATRTIDSPKDRLATILVAPLMSCSARLPVYTVLIAAVIPAEATVLGFLKLSGLTMLAMYLLGIVSALTMAWVLKRTLLKGEAPMLIMELPPYKRPMLLPVLRHMLERSKLFVRRAGTVILGISIILWFLATYPRDPALEAEYAAKRQALVTLPTPGDLAADQAARGRQEQLATLDQEATGERLRRSFAGMVGRSLEPLIAPLGFDWKIGIGLVASFAAREVFVSTMSTVYNVGDLGGESEESSRTLAETLRAQKRPDGSTLYTPLLGVSLMVFYVYALQCVSTIAVVRRETNSWKWPVFQWFYMGVLAWVSAFITYQGGKLLGFL